MEAQRREDKGRRRRWLGLLLLLLLALPLIGGAYWVVEWTEQRMQRVERVLVEELAALRAEVAALAKEQAARQEAVEHLARRTEQLLTAWEMQRLASAPVASLPASAASIPHVPVSTHGAPVVPKDVIAPLRPGEPIVDRAQFNAPTGTGDSRTSGRDNAGGDTAGLWPAVWAGIAYYGAKAAQYVSYVYQLARLHPAVP